MKRVVLFLSLLISGVAQAQPVENDLVGLGMHSELAEYLASIRSFTADVTITSGDLSLITTGKTIEYETGTAASACMGTGTFNGTTAVTISTTCAITGSKIFLSNTGDGSGSAGNDQHGCWATNISNGVSFDADCSDANNNATFNWVIFHEAP